MPPNDLWSCGNSTANAGRDALIARVVSWQLLVDDLRVRSMTEITVSARTLSSLAACVDIDSADEEIGIPGKVRRFPDLSFYGRTYSPFLPWHARRSATRVFGYVSFTHDGVGPDNFEARAHFTGDVAEANPDWQLDLNEMVLGNWRGEGQALR